MVSLLKILGSSPFKVNTLKKLQEIIEIEDEMKGDFIILGGLDVLFQIIAQIIVQILVDCLDFMAFRACEEALGVLQHLNISEEDDGKVIESFSKQECMKSMTIILQRGSKEATVSTISILKKPIKGLVCSNTCWRLHQIRFHPIKANLSALQVLVKILDSSKKSRSKAIEAGAMCTLIELLPDSNRSKCKKILQIIKLLYESADGRVEFIEHRLGIGVISKKLFNVSEMASNGTLIKK